MPAEVAQVKASLLSHMEDSPLRINTGFFTVSREALGRIVQMRILSYEDSDKRGFWHRAMVQKNGPKIDLDQVQLEPRCQNIVLFG